MTASATQTGRPPGPPPKPALVPADLALTGPVRPAFADPVRRAGFAVAADGSYGACLADAGGGAWFPERWTLGCAEPYTVPLPGLQPEEAGTQVVPLPDGRVLVRRGSAGRHDLALLRPTGTGTGEIPVGFLFGEEVRLLPPLANGSVYALARTGGGSTVWRVHGGPGLERRADLEGRCTGGVWLDRAGRMLALDRERDGLTKSVGVDLVTGEVWPLLEITGDSDDRLLLAAPDSGLLLVRSDAPGTPRLGWGVLGSGRPVRFPMCLGAYGDGSGEAAAVPVAVEPGHRLTPEACAVVLRIGDRSALWRPAALRPDPLPVPPGWLADGTRWRAPGVLRMPHAGPRQPYGVREITTDDYAPGVRPALTAPPRTPPALTAPTLVPAPAPPPPAPSGTAPSAPPPPDAAPPTPGAPGGDPAPVSRVLPLQQAPLAPPAE